MGGYELAERLRDLRPGLRVLFTSGYTDASIVRGESVHFIRKPFLPEDLVARVRETLDMDSGSEPAAAAEGAA